MRRQGARCRRVDVSRDAPRPDGAGKLPGWPLRRTALAGLLAVAASPATGSALAGRGSRSNGCRSTWPASETEPTVERAGCGVRAAGGGRDRPLRAADPGSSAGRRPSAELHRLSELAADACARACRAIDWLSCSPRRRPRAVASAAIETRRVWWSTPRSSTGADRQRVASSTTACIVTGEGAAARAGDGTLQAQLRRGPTGEPCDFSRSMATWAPPPAACP